MKSFSAVMKKEIYIFQCTESITYKGQHFNQPPLRWGDSSALTNVGSIVRCSAVICSVLQHSILYYTLVQSSAVQCIVVQCSVL